MSSVKPSVKDLGTPSTKDPVDTSSPTTSLWFLWPRIWPLSLEPAHIKDNSDNSSGSWQGLADAKLIIESSSDPYHYAVSWLHDGAIDSSDPVELAVAYTLSCNLPLLICRSQIPLDIRAAQERALSSALLSKGSVFPTISGYLRRRSLTTYGRLALQCAIPSSLQQVAEPYRERHIYRSLSRSNFVRSSRTRSVLVLAFHSWLPTKFVRTANLGSSGSSTDMAHLAASLVRQWLQRNNPHYNSHDYSIRIICLEGFGRLAQRTEALMKLLENWRAEIDNSDAIILVVTSHSVGFGLEAVLKLVQERCNTRTRRHKRISVISIGGAALGPVPGVDARVVRRAYTALEYDIIGDMIDLSRPLSEPARRMDAAVRTLLAHSNTRLIFCAAVEDLLVPLTSALATQYHHPRIICLLYGERGPDLATPEFASLLLEMIVTLKNVGWPCNFGVLQELSERCAGTETNGAAASMANDSCVYAEAVQVAMETTSLVCDCRHELMARLVTLPPIPLLLAPVSDTPFVWRLRCLLERLTLVNNIHNTRLLRHIVSDYRKWASTASGSRLFRDAHLLFGALADVGAEDLLV